MKVVAMYNKLKKEWDDAVQNAYARIPRGSSEEQRAKIAEKKAKAKEILRRNLQREVSKEFPSIVQGCQVCKWARQAEEERLELIPPTDQVRWTEVPNSWRVKFGLPLKGRSVGGEVPREVQIELDRTIAEHVMGSSDVTERKEVVDWESIASWIQRVGGLVVEWLRSMLAQVVFIRFQKPFGKEKQAKNGTGVTSKLLRGAKVHVRFIGNDSDGFVSR